MECWDWEFFDSVVASDTFAVSDCGPLFGPVTDFKLERDNALNLILETTSAGDSTSNAIERPAGSVYQADAQVKLEGLTGALAVATGVVPRGHRKTWSAKFEQSVTRERSSIHSLQWTRNRAAEPAYVIEWIGNMESFIWPDADESAESGEKRRTVRSPAREITMAVPIDNRGSGRTCVHLVVNGIEFFVGESKAESNHVKKPGFILYLGIPDEDTRAKIRDCLSFCLGTYLLYLGNCKFDSEWHPVAFDAKSGHALVKDASRLSGWQPSPLSLNWENEISSELLGRMMSSLSKSYDMYGLRTSFWAYWHAMAAPVHMKAVHFGAAIESLQNTFLTSTSNIQGRIVDDDKRWAGLYGQLSAVISGSDLADDTKKLLINKVKNLNLAPQSVLMQRFFATLGLELGALESRAWANRNRAAHGGSAKADNAPRLIRENKVLQIMTNRILLALAGGADWYYDYYTIGRPIRRLSESIPDDKGMETVSKIQIT